MGFLLDSRASKL